MTTPTIPKIALVTGGSRGLGRSTVLSLAKRGVDSIITYNSNRDAADKVVALKRVSTSIAPFRYCCEHRRSRCHCN